MSEQGEPQPWTRDDTISFPEPERELVRLAHAHLVENETTREKWRRQQWEVAQTMLKVAMDALRRLSPEESGNVPNASATLTMALHDVEGAYEALDSLSMTFLGYALDNVLRGNIRDLDSLHAVLTDG